jgi:hypothetical protein
MIQYLIVAVIVVFAALYAAVKYLPKAWREKLVYRLSGGTGRGRIVQWLGTDSSCGSGCDTCGTCETEPLPEKDAKGRNIVAPAEAGAQFCLRRRKVLGFPPAREVISGNAGNDGF